VTTETDHVVALWRLQSRYADLVTRRAWAELHEVFLPETTVHLDTVTNPPRSLVGPDAFAAFVGPAIERFDHFAFVILNTVVDLVVDGDDGAPGDATAATGRIFMCEIRHDRATDSWPTAYGVYQDRYARIGARWWFAERRYRSWARAGPETTVLGLPPELAGPPWPATRPAQEA